MPSPGAGGATAHVAADHNVREAAGAHAAGERRASRVAVPASSNTTHIMGRFLNSFSLPPAVAKPPRLSYRRRSSTSSQLVPPFHKTKCTEDDVTEDDVLDVVVDRLDVPPPVPFKSRDKLRCFMSGGQFDSVCAPAPHVPPWGVRVDKPTESRKLTTPFLLLLFSRVALGCTCR